MATEHTADKSAESKAPEAQNQAPEGEGQGTQEAASAEDLLEAAKREIEQHKDRFLRAHAEMENLRRRHAREREETAKFACESLLKGLIPVLDCLDKACAPTTGANGGGDAQAILTGVEMVRKQLLQVLAKHGMEPVPAAGVAFDPNLHQAVTKIECPNTVEETVRDEYARGYVLFGRLLRPAMVSVAVPAGPSGKEADAPEESPTEPA
jgi:molecular chaperone GrpE